MNVAQTTLDAAFGERVRTLREASEASRDDLARACWRAGLRWDAGRVAHLEQGRVAATIPTLIGVVQALSEVSSRSVAIYELLPDTGTIAFTDGRTFPAAMLRDALAGGSIAPTVAGPVEDPRLERGWGKVDDRLVADLGGGPEVIYGATRALYGHTATQERDARAGDDATAQKRGRITRRILDEVRAALTPTADQDETADAPIP